MPATATATRPARTATTELVLWWVPITIGGLPTDDCYVMAESAADAQAATVMAGFTLEPGCWAAAGIPRRPQHVPDGRCVAVYTDAPEGAKVWNFGTGARARLSAALTEKRVQIRAYEISWYRTTPAA